MDKKNILSDRKKDDFIWESPSKPRDIEKDLPHDTEQITESAVISQDKRGQFFVRFSKIVAEALELNTGFKLLFNLEVPVNKEKGFRVNTITCEVIRDNQKK
ncbi:MAG: hypothetical protein KAJ91_01525 [Candidatus Aenigmarchaeota archaeon]|nr:hypothetical protein [Candidatus Aenigmarchaeota archaeon]